MKNARATSVRQRPWTSSRLMPLSLLSTVTVLVLLSSGCASNSTNRLLPGVQPAQIPPLPQAGRQPQRSEAFSRSVLRDIESWEKKLIEPEKPASPAKQATTL